MAAARDAADLFALLDEPPDRVALAAVRSAITRG